MQAAAPSSDTPWRQTPRGAVVETTAYTVEIRNGAVARLWNNFTREEYLTGEPNERWRGSIPGGLGTQHGDAARQAAAELHTWPWNDLPIRDRWASHRFPDDASAFTFEQKSPAQVVLIYRNLTDGQTRYPDETFRLTAEVDATGDLLLTPAGESPRPGVFGAGLQIGRTRPAISVEAPIWDGIRITSDMAEALWHNQWPSFWDFQFLALNGQQRGAFGVWAQDGKFEFYKTLFFLVRDQTISLSLESFNTPPFDQLKTVTSVTWRVQAFDHSWAQAAARYREWRDGLTGIPIVPRPEYAKQISAVVQHVRPEEPHLAEFLKNWGKDSNRFAVWFPVVRRQGFDENHWDNTPYDKFKESMQIWNAKGGPPTIAYIQPMIMWGAQNAKTDEAKKIVGWAHASNTILPFRDGKSHPFNDQHHLGHPQWQRWFLDGVKDWIQNHGTRGIYHDQSYMCPIDSRGPINGLNTMQGMADYFRKANTENPNSLHATEHLQEANLVGCSLGIGPLTLWGTEPGMRPQRIHHASPVSAALQYPHAVTWHFTHDREGNGAATLVNWQSNMAENRAHIPYSDRPRRPSDAAEMLVDSIRLETFVRLGLRPVFPADWAPNVRTYFRGANGEDVRYERFGPKNGSQFVRYQSDGTREVLYSRLHGLRHATVPGAIHGWVCYTAAGPSGLHPDRYYVVDPAATRPAAWLEPVFRAVPDAPPLPHPYASYIEDGAANEYFLWARVRSLFPRLAGPRTGESFLLHAPAAPVAIYVNGKDVKLESGPQPNTWKFGTDQDAEVLVVLKSPPQRDPDKTTLLARRVNDFGCDVLLASHQTAQVSVSAKNEVRSLRTPQHQGQHDFARQQLHAPFVGAADAETTLELLELPAQTEIAVNGLPVKPAGGTWSLTLPANAVRVVTVTRLFAGAVRESGAPIELKWRWVTPPPAATP